MVAEQAELERRLNGGEELSPGEVAALVGLGRTTIHELLRTGKIRYTTTPGGHRRCNAEDVRRLLDERRRVYGGEDAAHLMPPGAEKAAALEALRRRDGETG